jgi:uncharacterized protein (DUF1684 family)
MIFPLPEEPPYSKRKDKEQTNRKGNTVLVAADFSHCSVAALRRATTIPNAPGFAWRRDVHFFQSIFNSPFGAKIIQRLWAGTPRFHQ